MKSPYGLEIPESCLTCQLKKTNAFCNLSDAPLKVLAQISHPTALPPGATLFVEGQQARSAVLLCSGKLKLSITASDGKLYTMRMAEAGDMIAISSTILNHPYDVTLETAETCVFVRIDHDHLMRLSSQFHEVGIRLAQSLAKEYQSVSGSIHNLIANRTSQKKFVQLALSWPTASVPNAEDDGEYPVRCSLTHEEMGQMIGASRETVTRIIANLKKKQVVRVEGSRMIFKSKQVLEGMIA